MSHPGNPASPESVPLQSAVLCVDCEFVSNSRTNVCPVCGGHSLLSLATIVGGQLIEQKNNSNDQSRLYLFDVQVFIKLAGMQAGELSGAIDAINRVVTSEFESHRSELHIEIQPVGSQIPIRKAA